MSEVLLELTSALAFIDDVSIRYQHGDAELDPSWAPLLGDLPRAAGSGRNGHASAAPNGHAVGSSTIPAVGALPATTAAVWPLVDAYRQRGHFAAQLDPLGLLEAADVPELEPAAWGLDLASTATVAPTGVHGLASGTVATIHAHLRATYCGSAGLEFMHIASPVKRAWLAERMERGSAAAPAAAVRRRMLEQLILAEGFERFCHVKYPGTKRFSIAGAEAMIALLDCMIEEGAELGINEIILGMAHRGRLNVLDEHHAASPSPTCSPSSRSTTPGRASAPAT
jgi:2-oxoglutarate dehydrogenase E1 component